MARNKTDIEWVRKEWKYILLFFAFTALNIVFSILCLENSDLSFFQSHKALFIALLMISMALLCGVGITLVCFERKTAVRISLSAFAFLFFCLAVVYVLQKLNFFALVKTSEDLQKYLERAGGWMPISYIVLQYLQVVVLPIPSIVSTIAGVAIFGAFKTSLFSFIGIFLGSITAFFIGRKWGYKAVAWIVGEEGLGKWQRKVKGKDDLVLTIMFVLPFFPDDMLCFIAGLSTMSIRYFLIAIAITRAFGIVATCYSFDFIPFDTWWGVLIWGILAAFLIVVFVFIYKHLDKMQRIFKRFKKKREDISTKNK